MLDTIEDLKRITGASTNCGWICDEVAWFIHSLVRFHRPELVIQTGHLWGKSAAAILEAFTDCEPLELTQQNADVKFAEFVERGRPRPKAQKLISIDPEPMGVPHWPSGIDYLRALWGESFEFRQQTSQEFFRDFTTDASLMGFVDGDHTDRGCEDDMRSLAKLGAKAIIVDDILWLPSLQYVVKDFADANGYGVSIHKVYNGIAVLTRG